MKALTAMQRTAMALLFACLAIAGCSENGERFEIVEAGYAVRDRHTGLVWQRCADGMGTQWPSGRADGCIGDAHVSTWGGALNLAKARAQSSGKAWRLPTVHELNSIVDAEQAYPALSVEVFPHYSDDLPPDGMRGSRLHPFWTINAYGNDPMSGYAWTVDFSEGHISNQDMSNRAYVRLVRQEKAGALALR